MCTKIPYQVNKIPAVDFKQSIWFLTVQELEVISKCKNSNVAGLKDATIQGYVRLALLSSRYR